MYFFERKSFLLFSAIAVTQKETKAEIIKKALQNNRNLAKQRVVMLIQQH